MRRTSPLLKLMSFFAVVFSVVLLQTPDVQGEQPPLVDFGIFFQPLPDKDTTESGTTPPPGGCKGCKRNSPVDDVKAVTDRAAEPSASAKTRQRAERIVLPDEPEQKASGPSPDANVWKQFPEVYGYCESKEVSTALQIANRRAMHASARLCYKYLKDFIYRPPQVRLTSQRMDGDPVFPDLPSRAHPKRGQNALENLKDECFVNLMEDPRTKDLIKRPEDAPKGAILVYTGGFKGGHIEMKSDYGSKSRYISDFRGRNPITHMNNPARGKSNPNYKLVGVMIKPSLPPGENHDPKKCSDRPRQKRVAP